MLKLAPIEYGLGKFTNCYWICRNTSAIEDAENQGSCLAAVGNIVESYPPVAPSPIRFATSITIGRFATLVENLSQRIRSGLPCPLVVDEKASKKSSKKRLAAI
jgi:hypothetical protein